MATRKRSRNITDDDVNYAVTLLDTWDGKLTWNLLIAAIEKNTSVRYTRQTLNMYEQIKLAYKLAKVRINGKPESKKDEHLTPGKIFLLKQQNERLKAECTRLKAENNNLLMQFARWAYNANIRGLTKEFLNQPLPTINRDGTKDKNYN
jgi:hypothetical protein